MNPASRPLDDLSPTGMLPCDMDRLAREGCGAVHEPAGWLRIILWSAAATAFVAMLLCCGCVTRSEHRAFVEASRGFFDSVAPVFSAATLADDGLAEQSKKNRLAEVKAYERALEAAEARAR